MAFSVSKSRPFRSLGLYKSSGKHAAPKGSVAAARRVTESAVPASMGPENTGAETADVTATPEQEAGHHPAHHAATSPRLTSPEAAKTAA
jgi:hypothetical protein